MDAGLFLKDINDIRVHIFAPVVDDELLGATCRSVLASIVDTAAADDKHHGDRKNTAENHTFRNPETNAFLCHGLALFCLFFLILRRWIGIHKDQQKQYGDKENRGKRVHLRFDSLADFRVNLCGKCIDTRSLRKVGDNEIVKGHRKGKQEARYNTRHDIREDDFPESVQRGSAKVERCLVRRFVRLFQFRHNA